MKTVSADRSIIASVAEHDGGDESMMVVSNDQ